MSAKQLIFVIFAIIFMVSSIVRVWKKDRKLYLMNTVLICSLNWMIWT